MDVKISRYFEEGKGRGKEGLVESANMMEIMIDEMIQDVEIIEKQNEEWGKLLKSNMCRYIEKLKNIQTEILNVCRQDLEDKKRKRSSKEDIESSQQETSSNLDAKSEKPGNTSRDSTMVSASPSEKRMKVLKGFSEEPISADIKDYISMLLNKISIYSKKIQEQSLKINQLENDIKDTLSSYNRSTTIKTLTEIFPRRDRSPETKHKLRQLEQEISLKDAQILKQGCLIISLNSQIEDLQKSLADSQAKLRKLQGHDLKRVKTALAFKGNEVKLLEEMVKSFQHNIHIKDKEIQQYKTSSQLYSSRSSSVLPSRSQPYRRYTEDSLLVEKLRNGMDSVQILLNEIQAMQQEYAVSDSETPLDPAHIQLKARQIEEIEKYYHTRREEILKEMREVARCYSKKQISLHYFREELQVLGLSEKLRGKLSISTIQLINQISLVLQ